MSLETKRERKEKGGERGEKKKGLLALMIFILPTLEIVSERQKSARDTPLGHLSRFLSRVVSRLMGVQKIRFRCRSGQSGQIFRSHLFKNPGRYRKQLLSDGKK